MKSLAAVLFSLVISACNAQQIAENKPILNTNGNTVQSRFNAPAGFQILKSEKASFAYYLQNLPLKANGSDVLLYNGAIKTNKVHAAVIDLEIGKQNLQQCADAIIRLRGEYLYQQKKQAEIAFNFTNGFRVAYSEWMKGNRMKVDGNKTYWEKRANPSDTYADFRKYMDLIFMYAGTKSLEKELVPIKNITDIQIGDIFIQGGSPGHAVIVVNIAQHPQSGKKVFMLAQSYMPAQEIHILKNPANTTLSPWYSTDFMNELRTPEWTFEKENLKRFPN